MACSSAAVARSGSSYQPLICPLLPAPAVVMLCLASSWQVKVACHDEWCSLLSTITKAVLGLDAYLFMYMIYGCLKIDVGDGKKIILL